MLGMDTNMPKTNSCFAIIITTLLSPYALGANWQRSASVETSIEYSDSVTVDAIKASDDVILSIRPGFGITGNGNHATLRARYDFQGQYYTDAGEVESYHDLTLQADMKAWQDRIRLFSNVSANQQISNINEGLLPDYTNNPDNLETVGNYQLGIEWLQPIGKLAELSLNSDLYYVDEKSSNDTLGYNLSIAGLSGRDFRRSFWQLGYDLNHQKPHQEKRSLSQSANVTLGYGLIEHWAVFINGYWEENDVPDSNDLDTAAWGPGIRFTPSDRSYIDVSYNFSLKKSNDDYWAARVNWVPSLRTGLNASYSKRFYGDAYDFSLYHNVRKIRSQLTYKESIESFASQLNRQFSNSGSLICPAGPINDLSQCEFSSLTNPQVGPDQQVVNLYSALPSIDNELFLSRDGKLSSVFKARKHTFSLSLFYIQRDYFSDTPDTDDYGGLFAWAWRVGQKTSIQLSSELRFLEQDDVSYTDQEQNHGISLSHTLGRRSLIVLGYTYTHRKSEAQSTDENSIKLSYQVVF